MAEGRSLAQAISPDTDIVHIVGNGFEGLGLAAARAAKRIGAGLTVWPAIHPGRWGDSHLDAQLYRMAQTVFCLSESERDLVVSLGVERRNAVLSPLGPFDGPRGDGDRFRSRLGLSGRSIVLFLARRDAYKGLEVLVNGFLAIRAVVPTATLVVAGPPGTCPRMFLDPTWAIDVGELSASEAADAVASADVLCVPSSAESLGIVVLDAWSRGVPVVVGPSPASRELVSCGGGIAVEQSPEEVAKAVIWLLANPTEARAMGLTGQAVQRQRFTWQKTVAVHVATWNALVEEMPM